MSCRDGELVRTDELAFHRRLSVFEQHLKHLAHVYVQLIECLGL